MATPSERSAAHARLLNLAGRLALAMEGGLRRLPSETQRVVLAAAQAEILWALALLLSGWRLMKDPKAAQAIYDLIAREDADALKPIFVALDELAPLTSGFVEAALKDQVPLAAARFGDAVLATNALVLAVILRSQRLRLLLNRLGDRLKHAGISPEGTDT